MPCSLPFFCDENRECAVGKAVRRAAGAREPVALRDVDSEDDNATTGRAR